MRWLWANRQWLFSGAGLAVVGLLYAFYDRMFGWLMANKWFLPDAIRIAILVICVVAFYVWVYLPRRSVTTHPSQPEKRSGSESLPVLLALQHVTHSHSVVSQETEPPSGLLLDITVDQIREEIRSRPPFQREEAKNHYVGMRVRFSGVVMHVEKSKHNENDALLLVKEKEAILGCVACFVNLTRYPEVKVLKQDAPITVVGSIKAIDDLYVTLVDASLSRPQT